MPKFSESKFEDGQVVEVRAKVVAHGQLTSDCWPIQVWGISYCATCEFLDTPECGGEAIRESINKGTFPEDGLPDQSEGDNNEK